MKAWFSVSIQARGTGAAPPFPGLVAVLLLTAGTLAGLLRRLRPAEVATPTACY